MNEPSITYPITKIAKIRGIDVTFEMKSANDIVQVFIPTDNVGMAMGIMGYCNEEGMNTKQFILDQPVATV